MFYGIVLRLKDSFASVYSRMTDATKAEHPNRRFLRLFQDDIRNMSMIPVFRREFPDDELQKSRRMVAILKYGAPSGGVLRQCMGLVISYDLRNEAAYWVCEHFHVDMENTIFIAGSLSEPCEEFGDEPEDPNDPDGENRRRLIAMNVRLRYLTSYSSATFNVLNIAAHVGKGFDRCVWYRLETHMQDLAARFGSVYVYSGPMYVPEFNSTTGEWQHEYACVSGKTVQVPTHFFKVAIIESKRVGGKPYMECYIMPNMELPANVPIRSFLSERLVIETCTGLNFYRGALRSTLVEDTGVEEVHHSTGPGAVVGESDC